MVDNLFDLSRSDQQLTLHKEVIAYWTAAGFAYSGEGEVTALDRDSVTIKLLEPADSNGEYPRGKRIKIPRFADQTRWSSHNRVRPAKTGNATQRPARS
ncbi:MAG: hypothetical protein GXP51_10815 [Deltaproteobacteria bacterium]|nr:hypothetical protein [Deltaproteobacteria bacterium]